jgi:hypothetical protein
VTGATQPTVRMAAMGGKPTLAEAKVSPAIRRISLNPRGANVTGHSLSPLRAAETRTLWTS